MIVRRLLLAVILVCGCLGAALHAFPPGGASEADDPMTPDKAQQALEFARQHHPELADLLIQLRKRDEKGYEAATRELFRTADRLERLQQRQPERYESELAIWKIDSRVRLLVARSVAEMDEATRSEIQSLLMQRNQLRAEQLREERDRLTTRIDRIDDSLQRLEHESATLAEQEADRLLKAARNQAGSRKGGSSAAQQKSPPQPGRSQAPR